MCARQKKFVEPRGRAIMDLMIELTTSEAQLMRMLAAFFGKDQVIPRMSVLAVCGGELPAGSRKELVAWAKSSRCLFTVVDREDRPKLVVEFFAGFQDSIDLQEEEHQRLLAPMLRELGIRYITISPEQFEELLDPDGDLDLFSLLAEHVDPSIVRVSRFEGGGG